MPDTSFELLSSSDPVTGLAEFMRTRPGAVLYPHCPQPDLVAPDLARIADALERTA